MQSCVCFWKVHGEQRCLDKDTASFILERKSERGRGNGTGRYTNKDTEGKRE